VEVGPTIAGSGQDHRPKRVTNIPEEAKWKKKMDEAFFYFLLLPAFRSPRAFLCMVLGDLCQARYKMLEDDFHSFYIYASFLSSRYVSFSFVFIPFILRAFRWQRSSANLDSGALRSSCRGYRKATVLKSQTVKTGLFLTECLIHRILYNFITSPLIRPLYLYSYDRCIGTGDVPGLNLGRVTSHVYWSFS